MSDQMRFDDRVAVVTGAGNGLGRAYAMELAGRGAKVLVNDLGGGIHGTGSDDTAARAVADEITALGGQAEANADTVATPEGGAAIIDQAIQTWGQVDIVINNAGAVVSRGSVHEVDPEDYVTDLMVAAGGTFFLSRAVWQHMWERNYGRILNVSSSAFLGMLSGAGYPAAKGAVWGLSRMMAVRAIRGERDIKVNTVMPTSGTRMTHLMGPAIDEGMKKYYPPEAAAAQAAFLVHADVPVNGEMFLIGGDRMNRVFTGITRGISGAEGQRLTMEQIRDGFDAVLDTDDFVLATSSLEKVLMDDRVDWSAGIGKVF